MPQYTATLKGNTGARTDVAKVVVSFGAQSFEVDPPSVGANQEFTFQIQHPGGANAQIGYAFKDAAGNVSARRDQTITFPPPPDVDAPEAPDQPLTLVSVVWA